MISGVYRSGWRVWKRIAAATCVALSGPAASSATWRCTSAACTARLPARRCSVNIRSTTG